MTTTIISPVAPSPTRTADISGCRVLLLQVRDQPRAELHEQACFLRRLGLPRSAMDCVNVVETRVPKLAEALSYDMVLLGGAGAHSAVGEDAFTVDLLALVRGVVEAGRPFLGSCYGHQFLARALGGEVVHDRAREEIGTLDVELTPHGAQDPLFSGFPSRFPVHLGHHDHVTRLPAGMLTLAATERSEHQAIRVAGAPVYGTQFHCELSCDDLRERLFMYQAYYLEAQSGPADVESLLGPTDLADGLLPRFLSLVMG